MRRIARDETATATVEAVLVMVPFAVLLVLAPVVYYWWSADQMTRIDAHRKTFFQVVAPIDPPPGRSSAFLVESWRNNPVNGPLQHLPHTSVLNDLPNTDVWGQATRTVQTTGVLAGTMVLTREALLVRPPWTWSGYPITWTESQDLVGSYVPTQVNEAGKVQAFYEGHRMDKLFQDQPVLKLLFEEGVKDALQLGSWD